MKNLVSEDIKEALAYYRKLFNYRAVYLFPAIRSATVSPLVVLGGSGKMIFRNAGQLAWLNSMHEPLTAGFLNKRMSAHHFFEFYGLDFLIPLRDGEQCMGFLGLDARGKSPNEVEVKIGELVVGYLMAFIKNLVLVQNIRQSSRQVETLLENLSTLLEISHVMESGENLQAMLEFIMQRCMEVMHVEAASLLLMDADGSQLEFRVALGPKGKEVKPYKVPLGQGVAGWVAKEGKPLLIPDAYKDNRFDPGYDKQTGFHTNSILCVPMIYHNRILGVLQALNRRDSESFSDDDTHLFTIFASLAGLAIENSRLLFSAIEHEKLEKEMELAARIQQLIIPEQLPRFPGLELSGISVPSHRVGGDFYAVFEADNKEIVFVIADVAGKGIPGALMVSSLNATLRAYFEFSRDLVQIMARLNKMIISVSTSNRFITAFLAKYNREDSSLEFINAGHFPPLLFRSAGDILKLKGGGMCLGILPFEYKKVKVKLERGDLLVMYTDGVVEASPFTGKAPPNMPAQMEQWIGKNTEGREIFGQERLKQIIRETFTLPVDDVRDAILQAVREHSMDGPLNDDLTLLVLRKK